MVGNCSKICPNGYKLPNLASLVTRDLSNNIKTQKSKFQEWQIQWGSEIRISLDFKLPEGGWVANGLDFKWDLKSKSTNNWNQNKWPPFCQKPFEIQKKRPDFEWLVFWMIGTTAIVIAKAQPFENRTIWNPTFKQSGFQMFPDFKWSDFKFLLYVI